MFVQQLEPVGGSLGWSALVAALPLIVVLILLGGVRMRAHYAGPIGLVVCLGVGWLGYGMPAGQTISSAVQGALFGLFPILWIVVNALWVYRMTVRTEHFDVLRRSFSGLSDDPRVQGLVIAFCFGALLEALAGFGAPVAICSVMLVALGFDPVRAAVLSLVANTAPVAFGAMATPVVTLAQVSGQPLDTVSSVVGRQTPLLALFVPVLLVALVDGRRGLRETWVPALVCGTGFAVAQFTVSNYLSPQLSDIVAALVGAGVLVCLPAARRPASEAVRADVLTGARSDDLDRVDARSDVVRAYAPYALIILVFSLAQVGPVKDLIARANWTFDWPLLNVADPDGKPVSANAFTLPVISQGGTLVLLAGLASVAVLRLPVRNAAAEWAATVWELRHAIATVTSVLALAYVMNLSGQAATIGHFVAAAGAGLAFLSPVLGWFGVAVSGSDTSANALFGGLQVSAAHESGLPADLLAAANSSGGVLGKMISPQNLAIACAAVGLKGREGDLLRRVLPWSLALLLIMCVIVMAQSTAVLGWMLP